MLSEITLDPDILRMMGPDVAVVHAVLAANDGGEGTRMTHAQLAKTAGITPITARRCIDKLRNAGWLKSEPQFQDNWQQANLYRIPTCVHPADGEQTPDHSEQTPAHIEQANSTCSTTTTSPSSSSEENLEVDYPYPGVAGEGPRPSGVNNVAQGPQGQPGPGGEAPPPSHRWTPPGTAMPVASGGSGPWRNLFDLCAEANWLVMHFEGHVLTRTNQERQARGWKTTDSVGEKRRDRWLSSAVALLSSHPLHEVLGVTDWLFSSCRGYLPASVVDHNSRHKPDRKVTRIQHVADYYEELVEMALGNPPPKSTEVPTKSDTLAQHQPTANYGEPFTDSDLESNVTELVSLFSDFRRVCDDRAITDFRTWGWAKTFRIMLATHSCEDIKAGIVALRACRDRVDVSRYHDAFHLKQEWHQVLRVIELHKVIQNAGVQRTEDQDDFQESPPPELSLLFDDECDDDV